MTSRRSNHNLAALGLSGTKDSWCLVKVRQEAGRFTVAGQYVATRKSGEDTAGVIESLFKQLPEDEQDLPTCVVLSDSVGLYRKIAAPTTDDDVIEKIVSAQVETMLPGGSEAVRWGWNRSGSDDSLWVHAATRREVDEILNELPDSVHVSSVIADSLAAAQLLLSDDHATDRARLGLLVGASRSAMILVDSGELKGVISFDGGTQALHGDNTTVWIEHLSEARNELLSTIAPDKRPEHCLMMCQPESTDRILDVSKQAAGIPLQRWNENDAIDGMNSQDLHVLLAAAAAASCIQPLTPTLRISEDADFTGRDRAYKKYALIAGVWLLLALSMLYLSDRYRAGKVNDLLDEGVLDEQRISQLDMQINVARYLEQSGPIPLAIMDEIGQEVDGYMFEAFSFERGGSVKLSGTMESADAIGKLTEDLAGMKTLDTVQLQGQSRSGKQIRYEIVAAVSPTYFGVFIEPPPEKDTQKEEATDGKGDADAGE